jgi:D-alanyl-D-alanine carboxypeptidase/D-alanyl-D-alanine-endopeptidase (penicillin-binding protein 4)
MPIYGNVVHFYQNNKKIDSIKPFYFFRDYKDLGIVQEKNWTRNMSGNNFTTTSESNKRTYFQVPFSQEHTPMVKAIELLNDTLDKKISFQNYISVPTNSFKSIKTVPTDSLLKIMMFRSDNFYADQIVLMASEQLLGKMDDAALLDTFSKTVFTNLPQRMRWVDGSGLSRYNLNTPENYIAILQQMQAKFGEARVKNLFEKGGEGTIAAYYKNFPGTIYAKTGTLGGQVALSGFIYTPKQQKLYFSVLVANHMSPSSAQVRRAVEAYLTNVTKGM